MDRREMRGISSIVVDRRLLSVLLVAVVLPVAVFGSVLVAVPGAGAGPAAWAAAQPPAPTPPSSPTPPQPTSPPSPTPSPTSSEPPAAPTNLTVVAVRSNSVTLSWTASTPGCCPLLGYDVSVWLAFNDAIGLNHVGDVTTAVINLRPASQYTIQVYARGVDGRTSSGSNSVLVMTPATDTGPDTTPPRTPADLAARDVTGWSAELTWSPATDDVGVAGYQVYRFDGWYTSTLLATVTGTSHRVDLLLFTRNIFYVRAVDAAGNLSIATPTLTLQATATPPPTPTPPTCRVDYRVQTQWRGGFIAEVTVHNLGSAPVDGWTLTFAYPDGQRVRTAWNTRHTQSGAIVTARDLRWNRTIPAGGGVSFGLLGTWTGGNATPTGFTLNDRPCVTG
jgi:cellulase/cellobiase CelA1